MNEQPSFVAWIIKQSSDKFELQNKDMNMGTGMSEKWTKYLTAKWERIKRVTDLGYPSNILLLVFAVNSLLQLMTQFPIQAVDGLLYE